MHAGGNSKPLARRDIDIDISLSARARGVPGKNVCALLSLNKLLFVSRVCNTFRSGITLPEDIQQTAFAICRIKTIYQIYIIFPL